MIKHLGESLTPFEEAGFSRTPELPVTGEAVSVICRVDGSDLTPSLHLHTGNEVITLSGKALPGRRHQFDLGVFAIPQKVQYRFFTDDEATDWFSFDVLTKEDHSTFSAMYRDGQKVCLRYGEDIVVSFTGGETLEVVTEQGKPTGVPSAFESISLPEGFLLEVSVSEKIWKLKRFSHIICEGNGLTLYRRADLSIAKIQTHMFMDCDYILGTGERFDAVNQKNRFSNGRVVEKFTHQGEQAYLPMPFFFTEKGLGWYRVSDIPAAMQFGNQLTFTQETEGICLAKDILFFGAPNTVLSKFIQHTGRPVLPPEWAFGVWISANGWNSDAEVEAQLSALKRFGYPASVIVLEAWSDERTFYQWNDTDHWKDPAAMVAKLRDNGLHLVLWQIPVIKHEWDGTPGEALTSDIQEAVEKGYVIKSADGSPYRITENWFHNSMLPDFTNPEAKRWWFEKRKYLLDMGVEGFKTDGGEFLFEKGAKLYDGSTGLAAHNLYPGQYIGAYHNFLLENGVNGVLFSRAGYVGAQTQPIHWAGDQLSEWSELNGQLRAGITAGLSGILFWGFDIGGFAGALPSAELYLRATAMACFSPIMQWHTEPRNGQFYGTYQQDYINDRSPWNLSEKLGDDQILTISCEFARLRQHLRPCLWEEAQHCVQANRPMMAHLCLDYPKDKRAFSIDDQYMLGRRYLVAPIVNEGALGRRVYLPRGTWRYFFTGELFEGERELYVDCPLDLIPVFERMGALDEDPH